MDTRLIQEHYDLASAYYKELWDKHLHHGYFITGHETHAKATKNLIDLLVKKGHLRNLKKGSKVLDIGCGLGATSMYFAEKFGFDVTGISISPVQIEYAKKMARRLKDRPEFFVHDANDIKIKGKFDLIWSVEMISHLNRRNSFFKRVTALMGDNARWCVAAWIKKSGLTTAQEKRYIRPIEDGMLVNLPTQEEYLRRFHENGLHIAYYEDISHEVEKTWAICSHILHKPELWELARKQGREFIHFLQAFKAMRDGFRSGCFRYAVMVVTK